MFFCSHVDPQTDNRGSTAIILSSNLDALPPHEPVTLASLKSEIGLVQNFFLAKLHANNDEALVEDDDLPQKQRFPKPRLPPTGKISSPRKRPIKEQGGNKSKKKKMESLGIAGAGAAGAGAGADAIPATKGLGISGSPVSTGPGKLRLALPISNTSNLSFPVSNGAGTGARESDKEDGGGPMGMMSPESIVAV